MAHDPKIDAHILQWDDLNSGQRRVVSDNIRTAGEQMPQRVATGIEKAKASSNKNASQTVSTLRGIAPHVRSEPVTMQRAANNRQRLYQDALVRQQGAGHPENVTPEGSDWYFEHHARIAQSADRHGFPPAWAHAGSAVMSPQNSPENERAAIKALMDAHATGRVHVTPDVHQHLASQGIDVSEHLGKTVHATDLPVGSLAHLSSAAIRSRVSTDVDLRGVARGGTKSNIAKAEQVILGEVGPKEAVVNRAGAISGSKVASYAHVISEAKPGSATHVEFMGRVHQDALARSKGGGTGKPSGPGNRYADYESSLDLYGHGSHEQPRDHLLSPHSHTVEDTWQNAVTFNQPKELVGEGPNKSSVFKAGGSGDQYPPGGLKTTRDAEGKVVAKAHTDARVSDAMLLHAYNNRATQKASEQQGRGTGTVLPPVATQGVAWTEARRQAGKSREGGEAGSDRERSPEQYQSEVDVYRRMGRTVPSFVRERAPETPDKFEEQHPGHVRGQMALFGSNLPAVRRSTDPASEMTSAQQEADMRKWAAIGNATRRADRRRL